MSTLQNKKIKDTYEGLLKTSTNLALDGTLTQIQDGTGQNSNVKINNLGEIELNTLRFSALEDSLAVSITGFLVSSELFLSTETKIPTVKSVKEYVDNNISAQDLDFSGNIGTGDVELDSEIFIIEGKSGITTEATSNALIIDGSALETNINTNTSGLATLNSEAEKIANKGVADGYAPLDANVKIPESFLPASIIGGLKFQGTWNAATDTPSLPLASTVNGHYYIVSVAGTFESIIYGVGDWIISNGVAWSKIDNTESVSTVFGRVGNVVGVGADYAAFYPTIAELATTNINVGINTTDIVNIKIDILNNSALISTAYILISGNESTGSINTSNILTNEANIATNVTNITENFNAITSSNIDIAANTAAIAAHPIIINGLVNNLGSQGSGGYDFMEWTSNITGSTQIPLWRNPQALKVAKITFVWMGSTALQIGAGEQVAFTIGNITNNTSAEIGNFNPLAPLFTLDTSFNNTFASGEVTFATPIPLAAFQNLAIVGTETGTVTPNNGELGISLLLLTV